MPKLIQEIVESYEKYVGHPARPYSTPGKPGISLEKNEGETIDPDKYRSIVGKIMYFVVKIFVEGSNAARELARHFSNPGKEHWEAIGRIVGYIKAHKDKIKLTYRRPTELRAVCNVDSNYATDKQDRRSITGAIYTLGGTITNWVSKTQQSVTLSSTEAEYMACSAAAQEIIFTQMIMNEFGVKVKPGVILEDNTGAIFLVKNQQVSQRTKHIDIRAHFIREHYEKGELTVLFVNTENNEADICTKNVTTEILEKHANNIREGKLHMLTKWKEIEEIGGQREDVRNQGESSLSTNQREHG
jgi:hypothetical protein